MDFCVWKLSLLALCLCSFLTNVHGWGGRFNREGEPMNSLKVANVEANLGWATQPLNHFDLLNSDTWEQRYYWNDSNYKAQANGSIFLFLGRYAPIDGYWIQHGAMMELCQQVHCIAFELEHRFYGESWPVDNTETEVLRHYLTIEQVLADTAHFIVTIKEKFSLQKSKVLLVGKGSYHGFLAAAARAKYPHLVNIAWASSASLNFRIDFPEYFGTVGRVIRDISQDCYDTIQEGFREIEKLAQHGEGCRKSDSAYNASRLDLPSDPLRPQGCPVIQHSFNLCQLLDFNTYDWPDRDNVRSLLETLGQDFASVVQFNNQMGENSMENQCAKIFNDNSKGLSPLRKLAKSNQLMNELNGLPCTDFSMNSFCRQFQQTEKVQPPSSPMLFTGPRQYLWLICSQFGFFQTSVQPFGSNFDVEYLKRRCQCAFGKRIFTESRFVENTKSTIRTFGGLPLAKKTSKILFVYGLNDPWSAAGVLDPEEASKSNLVIVMKGLSQGLDIFPTSPDDPTVLTTSRALIFNQIKEWLGLNFPHHGHSSHGHNSSTPGAGGHIAGNAEDEEFWKGWKE